MNIKLNEEIAVDVQVTQSYQCPSGEAHWQIDYMVDGVCIHSATTGAIRGNPDVIAMLDRKYIVEGPYHYKDIVNPDPIPESTANHLIKNQMVCLTGEKSRPVWYEEITLTHREAIIKAYSQIIK